jgi:hypothetical protein
VSTNEPKTVEGRSNDGNCAACQNGGTALPVFGSGWNSLGRRGLTLSLWRMITILEIMNSYRIARSAL